MNICINVLSDGNLVRKLWRCRHVLPLELLHWSWVRVAGRVKHKT